MSNTENYGAVLTNKKFRIKFWRQYYFYLPFTDKEIESQENLKYVQGYTVGKLSELTYKPNCLTPKHIYLQLHNC